MRAVNILSRKGHCEGHRHTVRERDLQGHVVATTRGGEYTYCMKCFISRRSRDAEWIFLKACAHDDRDPLAGGEVTRKGHVCSMKMETWKTLSQRPRLLCEKCGLKAWATMGFKKECRSPG